MSDSKIPVGGGPRVTALGGGTGLSTMLRGLKYYTNNLTAIVTVADDGGGSGMLRQDLGMPPPGDIRSCLQAMANAEPIMEDLLDYRFQEGSLAGQSFGNLFLAALNGISPSFDQAVARMSEVLAITGQVLPVTNENVNVVAQFENGTSVKGESKISAFKRAQNCRIAQVRMEPEHPACCAGRHPQGGHHPPGAGESVHQRHPQPVGGRRGGGGSPVQRPAHLHCQHHDPRGGDGGLYPVRPSESPLCPFQTWFSRPVLG